MSIEDVRARLRDRQVKDGARGTEEVIVCLDLEAISELERLQAEKALDEKPATGKARLGTPPAVPEVDPEIVAAIAEAEQRAQDSSLRLVFRAIGSAHYEKLLAKYSEADRDFEVQASFFGELADACLLQVWEWVDGEERQVEGLTIAEVRPELSYGEWEQITLKLTALNRRKVDLPFSLRSSRRNRR